MKQYGLFAAGVLFGTAGLKLLTSKDARKAYTHATAAVLRAKEDVMKTVTTLREGAGDIYADALDINTARTETEAQQVIEDCSQQIPEEPQQAE